MRNKTTLHIKHVSQSKRVSGDGRGGSFHNFIMKKNIEGWNQGKAPACYPKVVWRVNLNEFHSEGWA